LLPEEPESSHPKENTSNGESAQIPADCELEPIQEETSDRRTFDRGPLPEEGPGGEREENGIEDEPDQPLPTATEMRRLALLHVPRSTSRIASNLLGTIRDAYSLEDAAAQLGIHHLAMKRITLPENSHAKKGIRKRLSDVRTNLQQDPWSFALISALMLMLFALFMGEQVVAISVAGIVSGSTGLSTSPNCGNWQYVGYNLTGPQFSLYEYRTEGAAKERAVSYIDSCYGQAVVAESCKPYYNRTISYSEEHNASCPFFGDVCLYGQTSAYALDTGFVDSSVLGINAAKRYQFRRRTIYSPIVTNSPYVAYYHAANRTDLSPLSAYFFDEGTDPSVVQPVDFPFGHVDYGFANGYYHMLV